MVRWKGVGGVERGRERGERRWKVRRRRRKEAR